MPAEEKTGTSRDVIPVGAHVLIRLGFVTLAEKEVANGIARARPNMRRKGRFTVGETVLVEMIEGLGDRDLQAMANAPLMDPNRVYLPLGKVSEAEYRLRLAEDMKRARIASVEDRD